VEVVSYDSIVERGEVIDFNGSDRGYPQAPSFEPVQGVSISVTPISRAIRPQESFYLLLDDASPFTVARYPGHGLEDDFVVATLYPNSSDRLMIALDAPTEVLGFDHMTLFSPATELVFDFEFFDADDQLIETAAVPSTVLLSTEGLSPITAGAVALSLDGFRASRVAIGLSTVFPTNQLVSIRLDNLLLSAPVGGFGDRLPDPELEDLPFAFTPDPGPDPAPTPVPSPTAAALGLLALLGCAGRNRNA